MSNVPALITSSDVRLYAYQNDVNIDVSMFTPEYIFGVQIEHIKSKFPDAYQEIETKLIDGDVLSDVEVKLVTRLKHPLSILCKSSYLPEQHLQAVNAGIALQDGENYKQASTKGMAILQGTLESTANSLMSNVLEWYNKEIGFEDKPATDNFCGDVIF
tara:strand:- start:504 stop:980 length:477 start_codon:yes stop_codon:yes gene_type:complete